jgi:fatty-acyl-CoA synthase
MFDVGLEKNNANHFPLTPISFLHRTARTYPDHIAVIHGEIRRTWESTADRCSRLASGLAQQGIKAGDTVSIISPNIPEMFEAHFGIPMLGAVLNPLNTRLDPDSLAYILEHGESKALITDTEYSSVVSRALKKIKRDILIIDIDDPTSSGGERLGSKLYEELLDEGRAPFSLHVPEDEWDAISLNYTSGTTGKPKGVVYHHRGAYLNALSNIVGWDMGHHPVYLWTLPMFHCNGWCFPWSIAAVGGTNVCLRSVNAVNIYTAIENHKVTHFCGAPIILNLLIDSPKALQCNINHKVNVMTAASPPPPSILKQMESLGFAVTHVYGLTETYGPAAICAWNPEWNTLPAEEQAKLKSRQGVAYHVLEDLKILDPETLSPTQQDNEAVGEAMFRGNIVMKGYLKDPEATQTAFSGGWFHSGDLGVTHNDGYIELKDRSKDIIISGGENISSIEIENVLYQHPGISEAAVVARPDPVWGETPCAFVSLKNSNQALDENDLIEYCKNHLASYKVPKRIIFGDLPKTSTGKMQKFKLRADAKHLK